ncbi:MAG: hypothetical protein NVS3B10_08480 [Polyangiales bacterium]
MALAEGAAAGFGAVDAVGLAGGLTGGFFAEALASVVTTLGETGALKLPSAFRVPTIVDALADDATLAVGAGGFEDSTDPSFGAQRSPPDGPTAIGV